jgi:predicted phage tail protein
MRIVRLSGELGKKFGRVHRLLVKTPGEAIRALCANFPEFEKDLRESHKRNVGYRVINGNYELEKAEEVREPASGEIKIIPVIMGANATTRILIGVTLIAAALVMTVSGVGAGAAPYVMSAGIGLTLGGVIELLSPVPKIKEPDERPENKPSYIFNGPVNTTAQGHPVPIGYGRLRVGGGIVSAGISIDQIMAGFKRVSRTTTRNYYRTRKERYFDCRAGSSSKWSVQARASFVCKEWVHT